MHNYSGVAPTVSEVCSGNQFLGNTVGALQISDAFSLPATLLSRVGSRFRVTLSGQINNGTVPGNVTFGSGGVYGPAASLLPATTIPAAATPTPSTSYGFNMTWEWVCQGPNGNGYIAVNAIVSQSNTWTASPVFVNMGQWTLQFFLAQHGGNTDAFFFYITSAIAQAASGTTTFTNYVKFDYTAGPQ